MESRVVFERNLSALRKRSPQLVAQLEEASTEGIEREVGPTGAHVLKHEGVLLGSAYDPVREGEQIAGSMAEEPADLMLAIGFGLGEQFEPYLSRNPTTLIIFEPSVARLKAALERVSIVNLLATHRDLFLTTDIVQFERLFAAHYMPGLRARVFPHPAVLRIDQGAVSEAVDLTSRIKLSVDSRILTSIDMLMPWAWVTAMNGRRIAESPNFDRLQGAFSGQPAVVVAAGPSLDKQLPLLRAAQDHVVIIAIGQTVKALRKAGIEPHLVHILESQDVSHQLTDAGDTSSLCTAYTPDCHAATYDVPTRAKFCAIAGASPMGAWIAAATGEGESGFTMGGGTVAQGAVGLAYMLGCDRIALIGQDLAFTDGRVYANDSAYDFVSFDVGEDGTCRFTDMKKKAALTKSKPVELQDDLSRASLVTWVDGWYGDKVQTWPAYAAFIEQYRELGRALSASNVSLVNCTEGGARIDGLPHLAFRDFLDSVEPKPHGAREVLLENYDAFQPCGLSDYEAALQESRKLLDLVEVENDKGLRFIKKSRERLLAARNDEQRVHVLRKIVRNEKRVRRLLEKMPWLDALVQPEIYDALTASRRTERQDPTNEELADESAFLFQSAKNGIGRARQWFDGFESSFEGEVTEGEVTAEGPLGPPVDTRRSATAAAGRLGSEPLRSSEGHVAARAPEA